MAEQSIRHILMVTAVLQCVSETMQNGGDASDAAARCLEMFGRLFPNATRDELRSAVIEAERRKKEIKTLPGGDKSLDQQVGPRTSLALSMRNPRRTFSHKFSIRAGWRSNIFAPLAFVRRLRQFSRDLLRRPATFRSRRPAHARTNAQGVLLLHN